jgi:hypothetical protein
MGYRWYKCMEITRTELFKLLILPVFCSEFEKIVILQESLGNFKFLRDIARNLLAHSWSNPFENVPGVANPLVNL